MASPATRATEEMLEAGRATEMRQSDMDSSLWRRKIQAEKGEHVWEKIANKTKKPLKMELGRLTKAPYAFNFLILLAMTAKKFRGW